MLLKIFCIAGLKELRDDAVAKGKDAIEGEKAFHRFRVFYMACSELFNFNGGEECVFYWSCGDLALTRLFQMGCWSLLIQEEGSKLVGYTCVE